jgi:hypothetical protein
MNHLIHKPAVILCLLLLAAWSQAQTFGAGANMPDISEAKTDGYIKLIKKMLVRDYPGSSGSIYLNTMMYRELLATKTIYLFDRDLEHSGVLQEYYEPENGEPVLNPGFQNWNYLVLNMIAWLEGETVMEEF